MRGNATPCLLASAPYSWVYVFVIYVIRDKNRIAGQAFIFMLSADIWKILFILFPYFPMHVA
jgi:hypothetical protein